MIAKYFYKTDYRILENVLVENRGQKRGVMSWIKGKKEIFSLEFQVLSGGL